MDVYMFVFGGLLVLGRWHHKVWKVAIKTALKCCYSPKSCWNLLRPLSEQGIVWILWRELKIICYLCVLDFCRNWRANTEPS